MNTNKLWTKFLMAGMLLALLFTAGCSNEHDIKGPAEQALVEPGNAFLTCMKAGDFQATYDMMSADAQQALDMPLRIARGVVDLDSIIKSVGSPIVEWTFDDARIFTESGDVRGVLEGRVEYVDGTSGKVRLEFEQQGGTWKVRSSSLEN